MGEFFGAIAGALITGIFGLWLLKKQDDSKIDSMLEGADRKNRKDISNNEIAFNTAAQEENAEINRKLNELIQEQNKQNDENQKISHSIELLKTEQVDRWEQKKIDADIISKSIVDWLELARSVTSELCSSTLKICRLYDNYCFYALEITKQSDIQIQMNYQKKCDECLDQARQCRLKVQQSQIHFELLFGQNKRNNDLIDIFNGIISKVNWFSENQPTLASNGTEGITELKDKLESNNEEIDEAIQIFVNACRDYFKTEWVKAKTGKFNNKLTFNQRPFK